ncbi:Lon protease family protein [Marinicella rhabdoformis]|uniref:Lon protease family protein n=1 Tax=Marinicella rhabdoformis TaxID=2580566 RepID=UPI0015D077FA|nr:ATP-binding protein [Marinicella rhabdoformis]
MTDKTKLKWQDVRWLCDPDVLNFNNTTEVEPVTEVVGQDDALESLQFAIDCDAYGQNVFVRGLSGTGRMSMVSKILRDVKPKLNNKKEHCYVANFEQPDRPRLISLAAGEGVKFRKSIDQLCAFINDDLKKTMDSEALLKQKNNAEEQLQKQLDTLAKPFEKELAENEMAMLNVKTQQGEQTIIAPIIDGKVIDPNSWQQLISDGKVDEDTQKKLMETQHQYSKKLDEFGRKVNQVREQGMLEISNLMESHTRDEIKRQTKGLKRKYSEPAAIEFLVDIEEDVIDAFFYRRQKNYDPFERYAVNVLLHQCNDGKAPVLVERVPSLQNLLGTIESKWAENGPVMADHMSIRSGSLLAADGGFIVLDARDLLTEPGAWRTLIRTLKSRYLEIVPADMNWPGQPALKPDPIPVEFRVILLGDSGVYYGLDNQDPDFPELFKVLSDFDSVIPRNEIGYKHYAGVIAKIIKEDGLLPFKNTAVAKLIEHGARVCSQGGKLTAKFSRIADLAREGAFVASQLGNEEVSADHVSTAVKRTKKRAGLPARKFQENLQNGTINLETEGGVVGQINGLAVIHAGPIVYGFPSRITTSIGPGRAGVIDIEGMSGKSGSIHTKGFHILGGLLRHLMPVEHPLTFSASIAFEQSYGGIDGDSASGAEFCCLISALTGLPINQGFAMTGAIDQHGRLQAIGGVNEKIEGFFDTCSQRGLTGKQGVIIPASNAKELMLRSDVQDACRANQFSIHAVSYISEAMEVLMEKEAGVLIGGEYPDESIMGLAMKKAKEYWYLTQPKG